MDELNELLNKLRIAIERLHEKPNSEEFQSEVCLATRAAYTQFHLVGVIDGINDAAKESLRELLTSALHSLPIGDYSRSVSDRIEDFEKFCQQESATDEPVTTF